MRVLIAGANGQIGRHLLEQMADTEHEARALIRDPEQGPDLQKLGATETVVGNLEGDCREALRRCDAVIFAAGSGPKTGPEKTVDVDQNGAINLMDTAKKMGIKRFIIVSSMRADKPGDAPEKIRYYLEAKHKADEHLMASGLTYTIVRPGPLTEDSGSGRVDIRETLDRPGNIPREDVANVLLAVLNSDNCDNRTFEVLAGTTPLDEALALL